MAIVPATPRSSRHIGTVFCIAVPLVYGVLSLLFGQDANWDFENYHWYNAYALLNDRIGRDILVSQTPSFYNPLIDVPFYLAANHLPARFLGFVIGAVQGSNAILLFLLARGVIRRPDPMRTTLAIGVAAVGMVGGGMLGEVGTIFGDNIVSLGLFGGLLILLPYAAAPTRPAHFAIFAGMLMGAAAGLKQPHFVYCAGIGLAVLTLPGNPKRRLTIAAWLAAGGIVGVTLTAGFWMVHLAQAYGNPLFPFFNNIFHSPFGATNRDFRDTVLMPKSVMAALFYPIYFTLNPFLSGEVDERAPAIMALFVLMIAMAIIRLIRRNRSSDEGLTDPAGARFLLAAMAISYLFWLKMFSIYRYIVPLEMLAPLGVLLAFDAWPVAMRFKVATVAALLAICAATGVRGDWGRVPWRDRYVEIDAPKLAPDTMVLMAGYEPIGFIAAGLPPQFPVLRIQSNFLHPGDTPSRFTEIMTDRIAAHRGPLVMIYLRRDLPNVEQAMRDYHLTLDQASCRDIPNSLDDRGIVLCDVAKQS